MKWELEVEQDGPVAQSVESALDRREVDGSTPSRPTSALDVVVVGAGVTGRVVAAALRRQGRSVELIDNRRPDAGSRASAYLMKPSWYQALGAERTEPALQLLQELFGLDTWPFVEGPDGREFLLRLDPQKLPPANRLATVAKVVSGGVELEDGTFVAAQKVVVAAGYWTGVLLPEVELVAKAGLAMEWEGQHVEKNFLKLWAPYRHLIIFSPQSNTVYASDGSTLLPKSWTPERKQSTVERCAAAVGTDQPPTRLLYGVRPYPKNGAVGFCEEVRPGVWAATAGARNGTLLAGWAAKKLLQQL